MSGLKSDQIVHAPGLCDCDYTHTEDATACPCCDVPEGSDCINSMDDIIEAKEKMEQALWDLQRQDLIPRCRSGAHFLGNCCCIRREFRRV